MSIDPFRNVDWKLLRTQRLWLAEQQGEEADGLSHLLDSFVDDAIRDGIAGAYEALMEPEPA